MSKINANANVRIQNRSKGALELPYVEGMPKDPKERMLASYLDRQLVGHITERTFKGVVVERLMDNRVFLSLLNDNLIHVAHGVISAR